MKHITKLLSLFFIILISCTDNNIKDELSHEFVQQEMEQMIKSYENGDIEGAIKSYTEDAQMLEPGRPTLKGKEAIKKATETLLANVKFVGGSAEVIEVFTDKDNAYDISHMSFTIALNDSTNLTQKWKHMVVWERQLEGDWKIKRMIFNELRGE